MVSLLLTSLGTVPLILKGILRKYFEHTYDTDGIDKRGLIFECYDLELFIFNLSLSY